MPDMQKRTIKYSFKPCISIRDIFIISIPGLVVYIIAILLMQFSVTASIIILIINSIIFIMIILQICAIGTSYVIDNDGIFVKRMYLEKFFPFDDILCIKAVNHDNIVQNLTHGNSYQGEAGITENFLSLFKMEEAVQFSSVKIQLTDPSIPVRNGSLFKSANPDRYILVILKNGEQYLLTPRKYKLFLIIYSRIQTRRLQQL